MNSKEIKYETINDKVYFYSEKFDSVAQIDNIPAIVNSVKASTWVKKGRYLYSNKYKLYLHQLIFKILIPENYEKLGKQFVIDHINNQEPYNNCLENLHILKSDLNISKGHSLDKDIQRILKKAGIGFYIKYDDKFEPIDYQVAIGFNELIPIKYHDEIQYLFSVNLNFYTFRKMQNGTNFIIDWILNNEIIEIDKLPISNLPHFRQKYYNSFKQKESLIEKHDDEYFMKLNNDINNGPIILIQKPAQHDKP